MTELYRVIGIKEETYKNLKSPEDYVKGRVAQQIGTKYANHERLSGPKIKFHFDRPGEIYATYKEIFE